MTSSAEPSRAFNEHVGDLAQGVLTAADPYEAGLDFMGGLVDHMEAEEPAGSLYLIWGALTDWVALRPDEEQLAMSEMLRAAREWLTLDCDDRDAVDRYFDHWLYDVCGYKRR